MIKRSHSSESLNEILKKVSVEEEFFRNRVINDSYIKYLRDKYPNMKISDAHKKEFKYEEETMKEYKKSRLSFKN